jgi:hypothetical protein
MAQSQETSSTLESDVKILNTLVENCLAIVQSLEQTLKEITAAKKPDDGITKPFETTKNDQNIDVLSLASNAAALIRAHSTSLSLLLVNEPFTPSAVSKVVRDMLNKPLPTLTMAVQSCDPTRYTELFQRDLAQRCIQIPRHLTVLLERVPKDGKVLSIEGRNGTSTEKGSMAATGILWAACDEVMRFASRGVAAHFTKKIDEYRDTLRDIHSELKDWAEETSDDDEIDDEGIEVEAAPIPDPAVDALTNVMANADITNAQQIVDDFMDNQQKIPRDDPNKIRERLEACLKKLRGTVLLYSAINKRRIQTLPTLPRPIDSNIPDRLDEIMRLLKKIPEQFNDLVGAFYELDVSEIDRLTDECFFSAFAASELMATNWDGQTDRFSEWVKNYQRQIRTPDAQSASS